MYDKYEKNTRNAVVSNVLWRFAERTGAQLMSFIVTVLLARILEPSIYGTVAIINVFILVFQVFVDSGLGNALIQKKDADNIDFSTVFFTNIVFCGILYLLLFFIAPMIANFYDNSELVIYLRILGITILVSGIKNVQQAYVSSYMLFKKFFYSTLGGTVVAGVIAVWMAYNGLGIWSLIANYIINLTIDTLILWITVGWRPDLCFSKERLKGLFYYGWKLLVSSLLEVIYSNLSSLVIGKKYSTSQLAYYNQGNKLPIIIVSNINTSIDSVLLPVMSRKQDDTNNLKKMTRISLLISVYVLTPLMMGLAICGDSIVTLLLTEKWLPSLFFMRIFCIIYIFYPINTVNLNVLRAVGRSDIFLRLELMKKVVGIIILIISMRFGVEAIAWGMLLTSIIYLIINSFPNKKLIEYGCWEQIKDIIPIIITALLMGTAIYPIKYINFPCIVTLTIQIIFGALIYYFISRCFKLEPYKIFISIIQSYLQGRNQTNE